MALRSLVRKMPAVGLRSPAAAASRHMSHALPKKYNDPSPRLNKLWETMDRKIAEQEKDHKDMMAMVHRGWDKCDRQTKTYAYAVHAVSAFLVLNASASAIRSRL